MKRKQVLALMLAATVASGNTMPAFASDISGTQLSLDTGLENEGMEEDSKKEQNKENIEESKEETNKDSNKEVAGKSEESPVEEENSTYNKEETVSDSLESGKENPETKPQIGETIEIVHENEYVAKYKVLSDDALCLTEADYYRDPWNDEVIQEHLTFHSAVEYKGYQYKVTEAKIFFWHRDTAKIVTFEEGFERIAISEGIKWFSDFDKVEIPSSCSDFELTDKDVNGDCFEDYFETNYNTGKTNQWTKSIVFPNGSDYYEVRTVKGRTGVYSKVEEVEELHDGDVFEKGKYTFRVSEENGEKFLTLTKFHAAEKDEVIPFNYRYKGYDYKVKTIEADECDLHLDGVEHLTFEDGIENIILDRNAVLYQSSEKLKTIRFPSTLKELNTIDPFIRYSINLESYLIPEEATCDFRTIDGSVYSKDGKKLYAVPSAKKMDTFTISEDVEFVSSGAFLENEGIKHVVVEGKKTRLDDGALSEMSNVETIRINSDYIGQAVASDCPNLKKIYVNTDGNILVGFGNWCPNLEEVHLSGNFGYLSPEALMDCPSLKAYYEENTRYFKTVDGVLYNKDMTGLGKYPSGKTDKLFVIPETVNRANSLAFQKTQHLKELIIPKGMELVSVMISEPATPIDVYLSDLDHLNLKESSINFYASYVGGNLYAANQKTYEEAVNYATEDGTLTYGVEISQKGYPLESLNVNKKSVELKRNGTEQLHVNFAPAYATGTPVWTSENPEIATVDETGKITGLKGGETKITAAMGGKTTEVNVKVVVPLESILINQSEANLIKGDTLNLSVNYNPDDTTDDLTILWSSSNKNVVTVDKNGVVTAVGGGDAIITAKAINGITATCKVSVRVPLEKIELNKTSTTIHRGDSDKLSVVYTPNDTTDSKAITWESSNSDVATVGKDGSIHAVGIGSAVITVKGDNGTTDSCTVVVDAPLKSIQLIKEETVINRGSTESISVTYNPEDTTDSKELSWESSDEKVATVNKDGVISAVGIGQATITVTGANDTSDTLKVTVNAPLKEITMNKAEHTMNRGEDVQLSVTYNPEDTTDSKELTWESSDKKVATVDKNGKVKGLNPGSTIIKATGVNGVEAVCEITVKAPLKEISLNKENVEVHRGETEILSVTYNPEDTTDSKELSWESSNENVATVDERGTISAVGIGEATITVNGVNGTKDTCKITVDAPLKSIKLSKETMEMDHGATEKLSVTYNPEDTTDSKKLTWKSSNKKVVTVDKDGNVEAIGVGHATITVTGANDTKASCEITVKAPLKSISLNKKDEVVHKGDDLQLEVSYNPTNTTDTKDVVWESSNPEVATVDKNGLVTTKGVGTTTITVKGFNNTSDTCKITVDAPLKSISFKETSVTMNRSETKELSVVYNPEDTTDSKDLVWKSSNPEVVTVNKDGVITGVSAGTATITVKGANGTKAECEVKINVPLTSIQLNKKAALIHKGETSTLSVTFNPNDTTDSKYINWISSNEEVAVVNEDGQVRAVGVGTATITANGANGTKDSCEITVDAPLKSIKLSKETMEMNRGTTDKLSVTYNPEDTTDSKELTWNSSDGNVVKIDDNGTISAVGIGEATITVTTMNGLQETCKVTVKAPLESISLDKEVLSMIEGDEENLHVFYSPSDTTDAKDVAWSTSNKDVVTVKDGKVVAVKPGTATITATANGKTATCEVTVTRKEIALESITLDTENVDIIDGDTRQLRVSYNPTNTTVDKTVTWSSSNEEVAIVKNGLVKAVGVGTATITAEVGGKTAACVFNVKMREIALESISLNTPTLSMVEGKKEQLTVSYNPTNTTVDKTVTWTSSNEKVATVDKNGSVVGIDPGTATITATVGDKTATCEVTVNQKEIALESIELNLTEVKLVEGETEKLSVVYNPTNTTVDKTVTWETSDVDIVTVDADGTIKGMKPGTATITAMVGGKVIRINGKTAICKVTVVEDIPLTPLEPSTPGEKPNVKPDANKSETVQTGDPAQIGLFGSILAMSGVVLTKLGFKKKKDD